MKRLTYYSMKGSENDGWYLKSGVSKQDAVDRLAAYENSKLEPEEIKSLQAENIRLKKYEDKCHDCPIVCAKEEVKKAYDELEQVKRERDVFARHGKWIWNPNGMDFGLGAWECSECAVRNNNLPVNDKINPFLFSGSNYCPNCGAKMDGKE